MLTFVIALVCAAVATWFLVPILQRANIIDTPNHRSSHSAPIPRGGGLAVIAAVVAACAVAAASGNSPPWPPLVAAVALAGLGMADDVSSLPSLVRLGAQCAAGMGLAIWTIAVIQADRLVIALVFVAVTILVSGYVNAFNFMDGINGISSMSAVVAGLWSVFLGYRFDAPGLVVIGSALAGACLGFLPWNAPRARVFLGDSGSYGIGALIVSTSVWGWASGVPPILSAAPLLVYYADTGWTLLKRACGRRPLMQAHREHVYQRLVDGGWRHLAAASLCALTTVLVCLALLLESRGAAFLVAAALILLYLASPAVVLKEKPA